MSSEAKISLKSVPALTMGIFYCLQMQSLLTNSTPVSVQQVGGPGFPK